ncbi:hypothetical protein C2S51_038087 [Perilla frutescens var. frutescens]|nr:hypothetical protein C2S51_038087 [Perilla frutescens var. frutescens]
MSEANCPKLSLNVFINKQKSKVLFAEANNDVVDILLSFLTLPLGRIVRILEKHYSNEAPVIGSLTSLYRGLSNLDANHFCVGGAQQMLLNPRSSFESEFRRLKIDISESHPATYFICQDSECPHYECMIISMHSDIDKCKCGQTLNREIHEGDRVPGDAEGGVFTINDSSFIICDDLRVVPIVTGFLQTLNSLGITDADRAEMRSLSLGIDDIMDLLKFSLISATPLSDFIIKDRKMRSSTRVKLEPSEKGDANSRKIVLKVSLQKSTNKFLFAQATNEFADLLFCFLSVPLGGIEQLLGGKTSLKCIDNLYRSVTDVIEHKYFRTPHTKNRLINPKLAHGSCVSFNWIEGMGKNVKEQKMYIVRDDLSVAPYSIASSISILNGLGVPLSDVRETELHIGLEEALSILKASLTSTTAITDALINPMLNKLPKLQCQPKTHIKLVGQII